MRITLEEYDKFPKILSNICFLHYHEQVALTTAKAEIGSILPPVDRAYSD
jgi:hypothetical protein